MGNDKSKRNPLVLSEHEIQLLLHKTDLTREEILEWHKEFIEEHPDGQIDRDEFVRLYKGVVQSGEASDKYASALFELFDNERNGKLSLSDFLVITPFEIHGEEKAADESDPNELKQKEIENVDGKTLDLALEILNERADKIDKDELFKAPYVLCDVTGQNTNQIFESEELSKNKLFVLDKDKLERDEFLRLVRACKRFLV